MSRCVFNLHVPPYDSRLDTAAELDADFNMVLVGKEPHMIPVGSTGVRRAIEEFQPLAALHGHIHESPGMNRIGRTLCVNPGSDYHTGRISGCLVTLRGDQAQHQFVTG
jgi:Icc-related predicted phosphoesterase